MNDKMWLAIATVALVEALLFQYQPNLGWPFALALLVVAIQELLRKQRGN